MPMCVWCGPKWLMRDVGVVYHSEKKMTDMMAWWPGSPKSSSDVSCCVAIPGRTPPLCEFCTSMVFTPDVLPFTSLPLYVSLLVSVSIFMWPVYPPPCVSLLPVCGPFVLVCAWLPVWSCQLSSLHPQQIKHILSVQGAEQSLRFHLPQPCSSPEVVAQVPQDPRVRFSFLLFLN